MGQPKFHNLTAAPTPVAPYSHAVESDGWVQLTGQIPNDPKRPSAALPQGIEAQTRQVLDNLALVLGELGLGFDHVTAARVFLTHFERDYATMNAVYASYFPADRRPARTCVGVSALALGALIEIDMIARRP